MIQPMVVSLVSRCTWLESCYLTSSQPKKEVILGGGFSDVFFSREELRMNGNALT